MKKAPSDRRKPSSMDLQVGATVRLLRLDQGMTLSEAAEGLHLSHQQLQKYETGANRISAGMLFEIARHFKVRVESLFEGPDDDLAEADAAVARARRQCHVIIDRTESLSTLNSMASVLRVLPTE